MASATSAFARQLRHHRLPPLSALAIRPQPAAQWRNRQLQRGARPRANSSNASDVSGPHHKHDLPQHDEPRPRPAAPTPPRTESHGSTQAPSLSRAADRSPWSSLPLRSLQQSGATLLPIILSARQAVQQKLDTLQPRISTKLSDLNQRWNAYTGYESISALKSTVGELEASLASSRRELSDAKARYLAAVSTRSASQRATNDLLSRRASWSEQDLSEYTRLLRSEHQQAKEEDQAEKYLEEKERLVQTRFDDLMKGVMTRYHEEQVWSDRVRSVSTYGSIAVVGLNALLFILAIFVVEPYKRKRLAQTFETRLLQGEEQGRQLVQQTIHAFDAKVERLVDQLAAAVKGGAHAPYLAAELGGLGGAGIGIGPADSPSIATTTAPAAPAMMVDEEELGSAWQAQQDEVAKQLEDVVAADLALLPPPEVDSSLMTDAPTRQPQGERQRQTELVAASTAGVVAGALLSMVLGACWGGSA